MPKSSPVLSYVNAAALVAVMFAIIFTLYIGKPLILPLVVASVFWYIIIRLTDLYQSIPIFRKKLPYAAALWIAIVTAGVVIYLFFQLLTQSIASILGEASAYQNRLQVLLNEVNHLVGSQLQINELVSQVNLTNWVSKIAVIVSTVTSNFALIIVYVLFLLLERKTFNLKLKAICRTDRRYHRAQTIVYKIDHDINMYLKIKTAINAIAGTLSYLVMITFGVQYAEFWGVMFFLLHYIPFIGPTVGVVLVLLAVTIQITHWIPFVILAALLMAVQFFVGNFIEPRWMGNRLNLSPLVILLSLAFWGALWGVVGLFLCVPLMVILAIIFANFPVTRPIAVLLSSEGGIDLPMDVTE